MYAVIETGGKQFKVSPGMTLRLPRLEGEKGDEVSFDKVLFSSESKTPKVSGRILEQGRTRKVIVFKYKPKKRYRVKKGHRQHFTTVQISEF